MSPALKTTLSAFSLDSLSLSRSLLSLALSPEKYVTFTASKKAFEVQTDRQAHNTKNNIERRPRKERSSSSSSSSSCSATIPTYRGRVFVYAIPRPSDRPLFFPCQKSLPCASPISPLALDRERSRQRRLGRSFPVNRKRAQSGRN